MPDMSCEAEGSGESSMMEQAGVDESHEHQHIGDGEDSGQAGWVQEEDCMGYFLAFKSDSLEKNFASHILETDWRRRDAATCYLGMLLSIARAFNFIRSNKSFGVSSLVQAIVLMVVGAGFPAYILKWTRDMVNYAVWRRALTPWLKVIPFAAYGLVKCLEDPRNLWIPGSLPLFFARGFGKTAFSTLIIGSLAAPIPFKSHILVQAVCTAFSIGWLMHLSMYCQENTKVHEIMQQLGHMTEGFLVRLSVLGLPISIDHHMDKFHPCFMVGSFYSITIEFIVPVYIVYVIECVQRVRFLQRNASQRRKMKLWKLLVDRICLGTLYLAIGTQVVWAIGRIAVQSIVQGTQQP